MKDFSDRRREVLKNCLKDEVYHAAANILRKEGYQGLTMDRIAHEVGVSRATLYNYFKDATDLLVFIEGRVVRSVVAAVHEIAISIQTAPVKISAIANTVVDYLQEDRALTVALLRRPESQGRQAEHWVNIRDDMKEVLRGIVQDGIRRGELDRDLNPDVAAGILLSSIQGLVEAHLLSDLPVGNLASDVVTHLLNGLLARTKPQPARTGMD
jgi:AcrR family transcriptional regulator